MNVIPTKTYAPVRAWRWLSEALSTFWAGFADFLLSDCWSCSDFEAGRRYARQSISDGHIDTVRREVVMAEEFDEFTRGMAAELRTHNHKWTPSP